MEVKLPPQRVLQQLPVARLSLLGRKPQVLPPLRAVALCLWPKSTGALAMPLPVEEPAARLPTATPRHMCPSDLEVPPEALRSEEEELPLGAQEQVHLRPHLEALAPALGDPECLRLLEQNQALAVKQLARAHLFNLVDLLSHQL